MGRFRITQLISGNSAIIIGAVLVSAVVLTALLAPWVAPHDPLEQHRDATKLEPIYRRAADSPHGDKYLLGTDLQGRDVLSRVIWGSRVSLGVGLGAEALALFLGVLVGSLAGYTRPIFDEFWMRITDMFFAFPGILLAIAILAVVQEPGVWGLILALGLTAWPPIARVVRAQMLSLREEEYVLAAEAFGATPFRIVVRHLLPGCVAPITVMVTVGVAAAVLGEAGLSFLGLGVPPPHPSWGGMISEGRNYMQYMPWLSIYPGVALSLTVLGFNLLGDGLRDVLDPHGVTEQEV